MAPSLFVVAAKEEALAADWPQRVSANMVAKMQDYVRTYIPGNEFRSCFPFFSLPSYDCGILGLSQTVQSVTQCLHLQLQLRHLVVDGRCTISDLINSANTLTRRPARLIHTLGHLNSNSIWACTTNLGGGSKSTFHEEVESILDLCTYRSDLYFHSHLILSEILNGLRVFQRRHGTRLASASFPAGHCVCTQTEGGAEIVLVPIRVRASDHNCWSKIGNDLWYTVLDLLSLSQVQ